VFSFFFDFSSCNSFACLSFSILTRLRRSLSSFLAFSLCLFFSSSFSFSRAFFLIFSSSFAIFSFFFSSSLVCFSLFFSSSFVNLSFFLSLSIVLVEVTSETLLSFSSVECFLTLSITVFMIDLLLLTLFGLHSLSRLPSFPRFSFAACFSCCFFSLISFSLDNFSSLFLCFSFILSFFSSASF